MLYFLQQLLNGFHSAALYALLAFGYALVNGLVRRTNLAHGALFAFCGQVMILGAVFGYDALWLTLGASILFGTALAFLFGALTSGVLSRSVFEPLATRSSNSIVVATLGVSLVLLELARLAADTRDLWLPPLLAEPVVFASDAAFRVTLTWLQVANCALALLVVAASAVALSRSHFGRLWRAVRDDPHAAALCGVDVVRVFRQTLVAGGLAAALAGVLAALYFGNVSFGTGLVFGLKILFVTALGGFIEPTRAAAGAALFGIAESLWSGYFPIEWRDAWMFGLLVLLLIVRLRNDEAEQRV